MDLQEEEKVITSSSSKCENCGSELIFDPSICKLKCISCGSTFDINIIPSTQKKPLNFKDDVATEKWEKETKVVSCQTCGGKVVVSGLSVTEKCPYCGSSYVIEEKELPGLKPDGIIPFAFNKESAMQRFQKSVKKKFFLPSKFKKKIPNEDIAGLYIPSFAFDGDTYSIYDGMLTRTKTITTKKGTKVVTERFPIHGDYDYNYRNLIIESSSKLNDSQLQALLPFDLGCTLKYDDAFLRGFYAEYYDDTMSSCYDLAQVKVKRDIRSGILSHYSYSGVDYLNIKTTENNKLYTYVLLPVYLFEYKYGKKKYSTLMNGQNGKVGKGLPISPLKVLLVVFLALLIVGIFVTIFLLNY